jgi:hypothetical protein
MLGHLIYYEAQNPFIQYNGQGHKPQLGLHALLQGRICAPPPSKATADKAAAATSERSSHHVKISRTIDGNETLVCEADSN